MLYKVWTSQGSDQVSIRRRSGCSKVYNCIGKPLNESNHAWLNATGELFPAIHMPFAMTCSSTYIVVLSTPSLIFNHVLYFYQEIHLPSIRCGLQTLSQRIRRYVCVIAWDIRYTCGTGVLNCLIEQ